MPEKKKTVSARGRHARKKHRRIQWSGIWKWSLVTVACAVAFGILGYGYLLFSGDRLLKENLAKMNVPEASIVYDANGEEFYRFFRENRDLAQMEEIPELLIKAFVAKEDQRFYEHEGIDIWAIGRALMTDIMRGSLVQGGSTITQQLAKNLFLNPEKTFLRKATEASIAVALENQFSKNEIMMMYLNTIFFGQGAYGIKSASQVYFGKDNLHDLELWEIATLAAIPKAPSRYNPIDDPEKSKEQRAVVLRLMEEQGYITAEERKAASEVDYKPPQKKKATSGNQAFVDYVLAEIEEKTGITEEQLMIGGYRIYTTLNRKAQEAVHTTLSKPDWYTDDKADQKVEAGMVILDSKTGAIQAMFGGREYTARGVNRATEKHQPGSSFKPIAVYAPALESGDWHPYSQLVDQRMSFGDYQPRNYDGKYAGNVTMTEAIRTSKNVPAVWLLDQIGVDRGIAFAESVGIEMAKEDRNLAIALGGLTYGASPLEMAQAYTAFANNGVWSEAYAVQSITDAEGNVIYEHEPRSKQVMSAQSAYYMTRMLEKAVDSGTGQNARMNRAVAGKTGTTQIGLDGVQDPNANRDAWFVGYTPEWTAAIWMGFPRTDEEHYLKAKSGTPAKMFAEAMTLALEGTEPAEFTRPEGVKEMPSPPRPVQDLAAMYEDVERAVYLTWSGTGEGLVYHIYRKAEDEESFTRLHSTQEQLVRDYTAELGKEYTYYVVAYDPELGMESSQSNTVTIKLPAEEEYSFPPDGTLNPDGEEREESEDGEEGPHEDSSQEDESGSGPGIEINIRDWIERGLRGGTITGPGGSENQQGTGDSGSSMEDRNRSESSGGGTNRGSAESNSSGRNNAAGQTDGDTSGRAVEGGREAEEAAAY